VKKKIFSIVIMAKSKISNNSTGTKKFIDDESRKRRRNVSEEHEVFEHLNNELRKETLELSKMITQRANDEGQSPSSFDQEMIRDGEELFRRLTKEEKQRERYSNSLSVTSRASHETSSQKEEESMNCFTESDDVTDSSSVIHLDKNTPEEQILKYKTDDDKFGPYQSCRWCFTQFDLSTFKPQLYPFLNYLCGHYEITPKTGRRHFQGYLELDKKKTLTGLRNLFMKEKIKIGHCASCRGSLKQNQIYTSKKKSSDPTDTVFYEFGQPKDEEIIKYDIWENLNNDIIAGMTLDEVCKKYTQLSIKYGKGVKEHYERLTTKPFKYNLIDKYGSFLSWQEKIMNEHILKPSKEREIIWVIGRHGNDGKSQFVLHLLANHNYCLLDQADTKDLAHAYNGNNVVIDLAKSDDIKKFNYSFLEKIKNRSFFSAKYDSKGKISDAIPTIIVFSNAEPDINAYSADRWKIYEISKKRDIQDITSELITEGYDF